MSARQLVIVDVETTSLDVETAAVVEIAAVNTATGEELHFVPWHDPIDIERADPESLKVNRYHERGLERRMLDIDETVQHLERLGDMLDGNVLGGANPRFDARVLEQAFAASEVLAGWHHRLADVSAYTAGALRLPPNEIPGLAECCDLLGVTNEQEHSALADARATAACFAAMQRPHLTGVDSEIRFDREGLTIGGERVPGLIEVPALVGQADAPDQWRVTVTFLTNVYPTSTSDVVDEPVGETTRVIRPALPGDD
ncbi:hypothetical protein GS926_14935 [Rhodococcus hoagii]|nr:hypothetical protein [Prescottella equi]NKV46387.1 hypothetical protein [Prescottella equi]